MTEETYNRQDREPPRRRLRKTQAASADAGDSVSAGSEKRPARRPRPERNADGSATSVKTRPARKKGSDAKPAKEKTSKGRSTSKKGEIDLAVLKRRGFIVPDSPTTVTAEEFRLIKRTLLLNAFARGERAVPNGNLIMVCSSQPNEGKTYCAVNLALSLASEQDITVLLVDADFIKPEILSTLGLEGGRGLIDCIVNPSVSLADCLIRTNIDNLTVLPAGRQHNLTTELVASGRMGEMIQEIAKRYRDRVVIFDVPPALASSTASAMAMHVGQTVYVVGAEMTNETVIREGLSLLSECQSISLLLNKTKIVTSGRKFGSYYGYGG